MNKEIIIPTWLYDKIEDTANRYNRFIDVFNKGEFGTPDDVVVLAGEKIAETEKAIKVKLVTGGIVGSTAGWETWIPKSALLVH